MIVATTREILLANSLQPRLDASHTEFFNGFGRKRQAATRNVYGILTAKRLDGGMATVAKKAAVQRKWVFDLNA